MNPASLVRPPLVYVVLAEVALVTGLGAVSWHVWQDRFGPAPAAVAASPATPRPTVSTRAPRSPAEASPSPAPVSTPPPTSQPGPIPGLRTDPNFVSRMLVELNQVEGTLEDIEWRATKLIVDGLQRYVEGVIMPSIEHSESRR
jgi:hypothetical protein